MPKFGEKSRGQLLTCHEDLQRLFNEVIKHFDCSVLEGHRNEANQNAAFAARVSRLRWPESKHNRIPAEAVDVVPDPVRWSDVKRMYYFAGFVMAVAIGMDIPLRWGGDWDRDTEVLDNKFNDLCHFELLK